MIILDAIDTLLVSAGVAGGTTGWPIIKGFLPDDTDQAVAIFETGGPAPDRAAGGDIYKPTFQIRVRGPVLDYVAARAKMISIMNTVHNANITGLTYIYLAQSGPLPLGNDNNNRPNLVINITAMEVH